MVGCEGLSTLCINEAGTSELEVFYPIRSECQAAVPKTRFKLRTGKTLSARRWNAAFSQDGHLDMAKILRRIQRGGVHPSIKGVVWEFLLGCFDPNSTFGERNQLREQHREQYWAWKAECQKMVPAIGRGKVITTPITTDRDRTIEETSTNSDLHEKNGVISTDLDCCSDPGGNVNKIVADKKVIQWKLILPQIGLDVVRTDRSLVFYESETNQAKLWDVLAVYAWVDSDISYVQGMSDICSPMIILIENEADAFWCFEHAMQRLRENFKCGTSSVGVQAQLSTLSQIIKVIDPKLHQHLEVLDGGEYLFAFRMLMVLLRRELSFVDTLYLWELMWAMEYNPNIFSSYAKPRDAAQSSVASKINDKLLKQYGRFERRYAKTGCTEQHNAFAVFLVASIIETKNKRLRKEAKGLDDVILDEITGNLDAKKACKDALKIHNKYLSKTNK